MANAKSIYNTAMMYYAVEASTIDIKSVTELNATDAVAFAELFGTVWPESRMNPGKFFTLVMTAKTTDGNAVLTIAVTNGVQSYNPDTASFS